MKTVFITGSGRRLGKELATMFAENEWNIGLHYFFSETDALETFNELKGKVQKISCMKADVQNYTEFRECVRKTSEIIGVPDVFVNNAGIFPNMQPLAEITPEDWDLVMNINLRSGFYAAKKYSELLKESGKKCGRIINIASLGGMEIWKHRITYNVSKSGLITLTKALAREMAPEVSVNAVCPGTIIMNEPSGWPEINVSRIPMGRYGTPEDVFSAVQYFAECPAFLTGQVLIIDGGNHLIK